METIYADENAIADARDAARRTIDRYFKGTDILEETDHDETIKPKQKKVRETYDMGTAPTTTRKLLQQYQTLVFTFEKGTIGTVRVEEQDMEISDVVTQGNMHKWNPQLLPSTVRKIRMRDGIVEMTLRQPTDITTESKYWTGKGYTVLGNGDELVVLRDEDALCTISRKKVCIPKNNLKEYITNMKEM